MLSYIINLPSEKRRKKYILNAIKPFKTNINFKWISAIDGNKIKESDSKLLFDEDKYNKNHLWSITKAEIGCILSHRKCYEELLKTNSFYAMIIEDDVELNIDVISILDFIEDFMMIDSPRILLLSGWYWYYKKKKINDNISLCKIYDGRSAYSYLINRKAAEKILSNKPWHVADDWGKIRSLGVEIYCISPQIMRTNRKISKETTISLNQKKLLPFNLIKYLKVKKNGLIRRILKLIHRYQNWI